MRLSLLYNPFDIVERLAVASQRRRRRRRLRGTPAARLGLGHLDSLELLELLEPAPPAVIYDIGANVGTWTCLAKSIFPHARVEAFEPLAMHFEGFRRWTAPWPDDVRLHACALGASAREATMHVMDFSDASSLLPLSAIGADEFKVKPVGIQPVTIVTLDSFVAREKLAPPDLLKLDVQGYELEVLRGAEACLAQARAVLCEVSFRPFYSGQPLFSKVQEFLEQHGLVLHALGAGTRPGAPLAQTDALFLRSDSSTV
jgi:FkbM family methyltransferase